MSQTRQHYQLAQGSFPFGLGQADKPGDNRPDRRFMVA